MEFAQVQPPSRSSEAVSSRYYDSTECIEGQSEDLFSSEASNSQEDYSESSSEEESTRLESTWTDEESTCTPVRERFEDAPALTKQDLYKHIQARKHVEQMRKDLEDKEGKVNNLREKLAKCRGHISSLLAECKSLEQEKTQKVAANNLASVGLLTARIDKLEFEISTERTVEQDTAAKLEQAEIELSEAKVSSRHLEELEKSANAGESVIHAVKEREANLRLQKEANLTLNAERTRRLKEEENNRSLLEQEKATQTAIAEARLAQQTTRQLIRATSEKRREKEARDHMKHQDHLESRIKAMLSLKSNIESSQGTIQAQQMLVKEQERRRTKLLSEERSRILSEGGNPDEVFLTRQRLKEFERNKEHFQKKKKHKELVIVTRLLEERKTAERNEAKLAKPYWQGREEATRISTKPGKRKKTRKIKPTLTSNRDEDVPGEITTNKAKGAVITEPLPSSSDEDIAAKTFGGHAKGQQKDGEIESLAEPEIRGLWEGAPVVKKQSTQRLADGGGIAKEPSKAEREMMQTAMEKLKKSAIIKQVAAGREFKGRAFISKPEEVVFKDFELGRVYRKKLQLTNVSYTVNHCRLVGVSLHLRDFITVEFRPPGSMSAGLTCSMSVTFEPKLLEDLSGEIELLSQTGSFSIPLSCLTKKCLVSVDSTALEFGSVCVGETARKLVTLTNKGALPTEFTLSTKAATLHSNVLSESTQDSSSSSIVKPLANASVISIMSNVETGTGIENLGLGMGLVGDESVLDRCKSRSTNDLSDVSKTAISWDQTGKGPSGEAPIVDEPDQTDSEEAPAIQDENKDALVITAGESQVVLPELPPAITAVGGEEEEGGASGVLAGFSSQQVELLFSPVQPSQHSAEFLLSFSHPTVPQILVTATGCGVDVPVYVERETVDLRICSLHRLYQDSLTLHNRASTALRVTFEVPLPLQTCLEVLPKYGLVQAESSFSAQVKLTPLPSIFGEECRPYFNSSAGGHLKAPVAIQVADQTQQVHFTVLAQIMSSELEFSAAAIDFGSCTTHESVTATIKLTNKSILPQKFGFVHLPPVVEVQPNDGFGTLLPLETLSMDVIFSANKPKEYTFDLTIKTGFDSTYRLPCKGLGVLPALSLSQNSISFAPTVLGTTQSASLSLSNPRLHRLNSAVIRGAVLPQGTKAFEFAVPKDSPLSISPQVGTIPLGESVSVRVSLTPRLDPAVVGSRALELAREAAIAEQAKLAHQDSHPAEPEPANNKKKAKRQSSRGSNKSSLPSSSKTTLPSPSSPLPSSSKTSSSAHLTQQLEPPKEGSELWLKVCHAMLTEFENHCVQFSIPCFVSSEAPCDDGSNTAYRVEDTLYVAVTAAIVRPSLLLESAGPATVDFQSAGIGDAVSKTVRVKNVSKERLNLGASLLDPHGPFELRNALRPLPPGSSHQLVLQFFPQTSGTFHEPLKLCYGSSSYLELTLLGEGVKPEVTLSLENEEEGAGGGALDLGHAMAGDCVSKSFTLQNQSALCVMFAVEMEGSGRGRRRRKEEAFKTANLSGQAPFTCSPFQGTIEPGASCEITVSFSPDHQSPSYSDRLHIRINGQRTFSVHVRGQAWVSNMYVLGGDSPHPSEESLAAATLPPLPDGTAPPQALPTPLLVLFAHHSSKEEEEGERESGQASMHDTQAKVKSESSSKSKDGVANKSVSDVTSGANLAKTASKSGTVSTPAAAAGSTTRVIQVGCIKTQLVKKITGDFSIDAIPASNPHAKCFTIDPLKASVEAGGQASVRLTFRPPPKDCGTQTLEASTNLTLKGDTVQVYKLLLRGLVQE